ncbi:MAG TPA: hypothetical protein PK466_10595 [Thermotogota bacterium]|nr:hypothetical protein [Thermotogota bacterium]HPJ89121.1 hypothetical protein [Thermotogota bacterium]HPR96772.1 hypothetical protein [Thermotogota bacterium]
MIRIFIKGTALKEMLSVIDLSELVEKNTTVVYSIFDKRFNYSTSFISSAPSVHIAVEEKNGGTTMIMFLDMKSVTFSFSSESTLETSIPESLKRIATESILETNTIIATETGSIGDVIEDINFFTGYNIYVLGMASDSEERIDEMELDLFGIRCLFSKEETEHIKYNALLINYIAVESSVYEADNNHYIVPNVGIEGLELWLGTNPRFFLDLVVADDDDDLKMTKKYLYNMIFSRVAKCISERFEISHYSVSKVEKAFVIEDLTMDKVKELLYFVRIINAKALELFEETILNCAAFLGKEIKNAERKVKQLSTFYDENNIVGFVTMAYSDEDVLHKKLIEVLLNDTIPLLIKDVETTIGFIDDKLKKYINEGGDAVD